MIIFSFELNKATFQNWSREFGYFSFSYTADVFTPDKLLKDFEIILKRYFLVKKFVNKISEKEYKKIRQLLSRIILSKYQYGMTVKTDKHVYKLIVNVDENNLDNFKATLGDSAFVILNKADFI